MMSAKRKASPFGHLMAVLLLLALDGHQRLRRLFNRAFLRVAVAGLSLGLLAMVFSSLLALRQVTDNLESLISDSMVGLESSVSMRSAVRETQLDLLRLQLASDRILPAEDVAAFHARITGLLREYRSGYLEDQTNTSRIEHRLNEYVAALQPVVDKSRPALATINAADEAARQLINAVEEAYQFNRRRIHATVDDAGNAARRAIEISNRLWVSFGLFTVIVGLIYLAYRWLALPEGNDS